MTAVFAILALAATIILLAALVTLHALPSGLSPISDPVSAYALTRFRWGYAVAAIAAGIAGAVVAVELAGVIHSPAAIVLLWIFAVARVLIPLFPMDRPGTPRSRSGRTHGRLAITAFATVTAAGFVASVPLADAGFAALSTATTVTAIVMAIGCAGVLAAAAGGRPRRIFGITERLIYLGFIAWFLILSIGMLSG